MTRFEMELSGKLGTYWQNEAEKELAKIEKKLENGEITIDENGVGRNCIGRVLMSDMAEKVWYVDSRLNKEATAEARSEEVSKEIAELRKNYKGPSAEQLAEMRSVYGKGEKVVDLISGKVYQF